MQCQAYTEKNLKITKIYSSNIYKCCCVFEVLENHGSNDCLRFDPKFQVQVSHLLKFIGYLVFVGYLAAKDSSDSSFNKHSRGVA